MALNLQQASSHLNMDHKSCHKFVLFFVSLICFFPAAFLGQSDDPCPSFQCGNISLITYPFWDLDAASARRTGVLENISQPLCGYPGFGLRCRRAVPILVVSLLRYRVLDTYFNNHTLKLLRQDLWENPCDPFLPAADTYTAFVSSTLFSIPPSYKHSNLTIHYNCTPGPGSNTNKGYHNFTCGEAGTTNILTVGNASMDDFNFSCGRRTTVPVNKSAATALETSTASPLDALHAALAGGFLVQWFADDDFCSNCTRLRLACLYDLTTNKSLCDSSTRKSRIVDPNPGAAHPPAPPNQGVNSSAPNPNDGRPKMAANTTNFPTNLNHKASNRTRLVLGVAFGGIGFILVFILISWLCKRQHCPDGTSDPTNPNIEKFILQQESLATKRYRYSEIKKITKSFSDKLGQGGYGSVYKGMLASGSPVAVKLLFETDSNDEEFINEVASISRTSHVNIVSLLGFCYERNKRALIYEFMPNKSLDKFIRDTDTSQEVEKLYNISVGVAKGLEYLHTGCNSRIVHFDIKPQNILLDENFCPKIADFGLAKLCKKQQSILSVEGLRGTTGYIAPEVFSRNFGGVSHRSDVYSFGVMLLEMAGAKKFVEPDSIQSSENYFPDKIYEHVVRNVDYETSMLKQEDDEWVKKMFLVGFWCMQTIPLDRPLISKVVEMLEGDIESIPIPPKPFLFNPEQRGEGPQGFSSLMPSGSEIEASNEISYVTTETTWKTSTEEDTSLESKR